MYEVGTKVRNANSGVVYLVLAHNETMNTYLIGDVWITYMTLYANYYTQR